MATTQEEEAVPDKMTLEEMFDSRLLFNEEDSAIIENTCKPFKALMEKLNTLNADVVLHAIEGLETSLNYNEESYEDIIESNSLREQKLSNANLNFATRTCFTTSEMLSTELKKLKEKYVKEKKEFKALQPDKKKMYVMKAKHERYRKELVNIVKQFDVVADKRLRLSNIVTEANVLEGLREEHGQLEKQLEKYKGLKPDLIEAKKQLLAHKQLHEELEAQYKFK